MLGVREVVRLQGKALVTTAPEPGGASSGAAHAAAGAKAATCAGSLLVLGLALGEGVAGPEH